MIALFAVFAIFNVKRRREQTRQSTEKDIVSESIETVRTHRTILIEVLNPDFIDFQHYAIGNRSGTVFSPKDPCLVLGAPAPQLVAVWSARFMRALMYFHCFSCIY